MNWQFGGRGLEAVGSPKFFRARHAPLAGASTVHTADALMRQCKLLCCERRGLLKPLQGGCYFIPNEIE